MILISEKALEDVIEEDFMTPVLQNYIEKQLSVQQVLLYMTGSDRIPAGGFHPEPRVTFTHSDRLPFAPTCSNELQLAVCERTMDVPSFCCDMLTALLNGEMFTKM